MDEYHQLFCNIHLADNLEALWALNIQGYDENQVPAIWDKPSGITENADFEAWLKAGLNKVKEIEDYVPGETERKIYDLEDDLLPDGLKENDLVSFIGDKYRNLKFQEFKNNFRGHGDEAAGATDEEIELYFELDINELRGNSDTGITAEIRGKTCFNPTEKATTFDKGGKREKFEE
ncbi:4490_t:CDS:2 [Paraglomus occultum]|uniref:4490_t:CDS:1 n=1 Tax=Paraglomus occultum TaxID=144539 RepID=A0A9N9AZK1_9GLOM|nr:4490_t:CDS:2 [Paraglomus occultum]